MSSKKYAVNKVVIIPMPKVTENPLTGPEPKAKKNDCCNQCCYICI